MTFDATRLAADADIPPEVCAVLYSRIQCASLSDLFQRFPDVHDKLLTAQIVASGTSFDAWAPWVIESLINDIHRVQLESWMPVTSN